MKKKITTGRTPAFIVSLFTLALVIPSVSHALSFSTKWGSQGNANGQFDPPRGVATDGTNVYVADVDNHRIQKFDANGNFIAKFEKAGGGFGNGAGEFNQPWALITDSANNLWVVDKGNDRIQKINPVTGAQICELGGFNNPEDIDVGPDDKIWVANTTGASLVRVSNACASEATFALGIAPRGVAVSGTNVYVNSSAIVRRFDTSGNQQAEFGTGLLNNGRASGASPNGDLWITSLDQDRLTVFRNDAFLMNFSSQGAGDGQLDEPHGLDFDAAGNLYVAERLNFRISKFTETPTDLGDAPATYPTKKADTGAEHVIGGAFLGTVAPDPEGDGQPDANALGDDSNDTSGTAAGDDEDGINLPDLIAGATQNLEVTASGAALLSGWIDFNQDNTWAAGEQILNEQPLGGGSQTLTGVISVPESATLGNTFARFRLCSAANNCNTPTGTAADGEVEDYMVNINLPSLSINDVNIAEGNNGANNLTFTISLSHAVSQNVSVTFDTADDSATSGDYVAIAAGTANINAGSTSTTIDVVLNGDVLVENNETFFVNLSNPSGAVIADAQGVGTINNDDSLPQITVAAAPGAVSTTTAGSTNVIMMAADITVPAYPENLSFTSLDIAASGTGQDQADVTNVRLWRDDGDGAFDANTDTMVINGQYAADNGTLTLNANLTLTAGTTTRFFITYDFNTTLAAWALPMLAGLPLLAGLGLLGLGGRRQRTMLLVAVIACTCVGLTGCPDDNKKKSSTATTPAVQGKTFIVSPTAVNASFPSGSPDTSGLPVSGPTVTVPQ